MPPHAQFIQGPTTASVTATATLFQDAEPTWPLAQISVHLTEIPTVIAISLNP